MAVVLESLPQRLQDLSATQQSIQTLSLWIQHHREHASDIVKIWLRELQNDTSAKKLKYIFLANDVILQSRKKGPMLIESFQAALPEAFKNLHAHCDSATIAQVRRMLTIWGERQAFPESTLAQLAQQLAPAVEEPKVPAVPTDNASTITAALLAEETIREAAGLVAALPQPAPITSDTDITQQQRKASEAVAAVEEARRKAAAAVAHGERALSHLLGAAVDHRQLLSSCQSRLAQCRSAIARLAANRRDLRKHMENIKTSSHELAPLPAAADLFSPGELDDDDNLDMTGYAEAEADDLSPVKRSRRDSEDLYSPS